MSHPSPPDLRVAYMGPAGSFSHQAANLAFGEGFHAVETRSIAEAIEAVARSAADAALAPIENSIEGGVNATLDTLFELDVAIAGELVLDIELCLLSRAERLADVERVASHPQPLAQSRRWLTEHLPQAAQLVASSTSAAAQDALVDPGVAAIGGPLLARLTGLPILRQGIQDFGGNATRFVVIRAQDAAPSGRDKTSLVFSAPHERGALRRVLEIFDDEGLNLTRIESRPARGERWQYVFFTDLEGHRLDAATARSLSRLRGLGAMVRVLGSYPRA